MANDTIRFDPENRGLILPLEEQDFAKFIAGLLGRPQTIEKRWTIRFEIELDDIVSCFHLVDQRVTQQNQANIVQFAIRIDYDDGSSVTLNSLQDLNTYNEVRNLASVGVSLNWTYLIRFQTSTVPEKQTIDLYLDGDYRSAPRRLGAAALNPIILPVLTRITERKENVRLRIEHTARTWGSDIENLISGQVDKWNIRSPFVEDIFRNHNILISFLASLLFSAPAAFWIYESISELIVRNRVEISKALVAGADEKLNFLIRALAADPMQFSSGKYAIEILYVFVTTLFIWGFLAGISEIRPKSFVALSKGTKKSLESYRANKKWSLKYFIGSAIASTAAGVASKFIFSLIN